MKYLTNYKIFESETSEQIMQEELTEIISNLKDMSLELQDNECEVVIGPSVDPAIRFNGIRHQFRPRILYFNIILPKSLSSRYEKLPDWFIETLNQISDYMESEGFRTSYWLNIATDSFSIYRNFNSLEDLSSLKSFCCQVRLEFLF